MSATNTLYGRSPGLYARPFYGYMPAGGVTPTYPTVHAIYFNTTSILLKWGLIDNANAYQVQVSPTPDFSGTLLVNVTGIDVHQYSFTDTGTNDTKRWWRWRYSYDGGSNYNEWSEVGSYWINTSGAQSVNLQRNKWAMINPSPVTDRYLLPEFPTYLIKQAHLYRVRERNRLGTMLSEYITLKGGVHLAFDKSNYMGAQSFFEMRRFNEEIKTFFLATFKSSLLQTPTPNIWKVQFETDPEMAMFVAGRQDLFVGTLNLTEV